MADDGMSGAGQVRLAQHEAGQAVDALIAALNEGGAEAIGRLPVVLASALALVLARSGTSEGLAAAEGLYERLRPLAGETTKQDDDLATLALAIGHAEEARALVTQRLERSEALNAYQILARALVALGRSDDARALAERLMAEAGDRATTWLLAGETLLAVGDPGGSERAFREALRMTPGGSGAQLGLARCLATHGDAGGARDLVDKVFAVYSGVPSLWVVREACAAADALEDAEWKAELTVILHVRLAEDARAMQRGITAALTKPVSLGHSVGEATTLGRARQSARRTAASTPPAEDLPVLSVQEAVEEAPALEVFEALRDVFGYEGLLPGQAAVLAGVMRGENLLAIMPTGAGKSLCYQLPALLLPGVTVLVSPLIALMKDQIEGLPPAARARTTILNSMLDPAEIERRLVDVAAGRYKLVYAAPERLRQQPFIYALRRGGVARFVVDEAHCVSIWGHDFRPDYLFIARALRQLGDGGAPPPVLALTATATPDIRESIGEALERDLRVINRGVFRPNLRYEVVHAGNNDERLRALARIVGETPGAGIVYVRSREGCEEVAEFLRRRCGVRAIHYHAGMERAEREAAQNAFISSEARIVVATVAFGMGIDKADVRCIVHFQLPSSLEAYAQESGRAGRDGKPARCVLFSSTADASALRRHLRQDELSVETLRAVYAAARTLARAGAPPGSTLGRVAANDLERAIGEAIARTRESEHTGTIARGVDETAVRVALSLLERAGFLRRHPDVPRAPMVRLGREVPAEAGEAEALRAFGRAAGLTPGQSRTLEMVALAAQLEMSPALLEDRLLGWRDAELIDYHPGARDLLLEIAPPPPDGKTRLPELLATLAERHELQIASLVEYTRTHECRQQAIARHFGERLPVERCGICDLCQGGAPAARGVFSASRAQRPPRVRDDAVVRETILACLRDLPYEVGVSGLVRVLRGSVDTGRGATRSPYYGAMAGVGEGRLTREIQAMIAEGVLSRDESGTYPLLRVVEI